MLIVVLLAKPVAHLGPRPGGFQIAEIGIEPIAAGRGVARGEDFDLIA